MRIYTLQISDAAHRLVNLVAEDNAIEDTIYHLHRALNTGRIDLERFLRVSISPTCIHTTSHRL